MRVQPRPPTPETKRAWWNVSTNVVAQRNAQLTTLTSVLAS